MNQLSSAEAAEFVVDVSVRFVRKVVSKRRTILGFDEEIGQEYLNGALSKLLNQLESLELVGEANRELSQLMWWIAGGVLKTGWLQNRARSKPFGYAGDFELLDRIGRNWVSPDRLGGCFDRFFQQQAAPQAVRNRMLHIANTTSTKAVEGEPMKVVSIGSGSAREIAWLIQRISDPTRQLAEIILVDIDDAALSFARGHLESLFPTERIITIRENLLRIHQRPALFEQLKNASVVYCLGLFDYLADEVASEMLRFFYSLLATGGTMTAFNFAAEHSTRTYMEWVGNWYLNYRTADELKSLANTAGLAENYRIDREPLSVNWFVEATKP